MYFHSLYQERHQKMCLGFYGEQAFQAFQRKNVHF